MFITSFCIFILTVKWCGWKVASSRSFHLQGRWDSFDALHPISKRVFKLETRKKYVFLTSAHNKLCNEKRWALFKLDMKKHVVLTRGQNKTNSAVRNARHCSNLVIALKDTCLEPAPQANSEMSNAGHGSKLIRKNMCSQTGPWETQGRVQSWYEKSHACWHQMLESLIDYLGQLINKLARNCHLIPTFDIIEKWSDYHLLLDPA